MENILGELIKQIPNAAAVILTVWLFLQAQARAEESRITNAKALEAEREKHEREINNMWAQFLKNLSADNAQNFKQIVDEIHRHESASAKRYDRMKVTQKLKNAAREKSQRNGP